MGDFNSILSCEDRWGGTISSLAEMEDFNSCTITLGLEEAFSIGSKFSSSNGTFWSRIDKVLLNPQWHMLNLHCLADYTQFNSLLDHTPLVVSLSPQTQALHRPFKFYNMWMIHPRFHKILIDNWSIPVIGTKQFFICMKLKALKPHLRALNKLELSYISERVKRAEAAFSEVQTQLMNDPSSTILVLESERLFLQQKLKNKHNLLADRNTSYFHSLDKKRNSSSTVATLSKSDETFTTSQEEVIKEFITYFENLLGTETHDTPITDEFIKKGVVLTDDDRDFLISPILDLEIKEALYQNSSFCKNSCNIKQLCATHRH